MKAQKEKLTVQDLLDKEKTKNRRIVTAVIFAVGLLAGFIGGYFISIDVTSQANARVVNSIQLSVKEQK